MDRTRLYLKTAFCCMACDGAIAPEEISVIKSLYNAGGNDITAELEEYNQKLREQGKHFIIGYLKEIEEAMLSADEECRLANVAVQVIEADNEIEYNEIAFFKKIRSRLHVDDQTLLGAISHNHDLDDVVSIEDYLLPDIAETEDFDFLNGVEAQLQGLMIVP